MAQFLTLCTLDRKLDLVTKCVVLKKILKGKNNDLWMISKSKDSRKLRDEAMSRIEHVSMVASYRQKLLIVSCIL